MVVILGLLRRSRSLLQSRNLSPINVHLTAVVWLLFSGNAISTKVGAGRVITQLRLGPSVVMLGLIWAVVISIVGGLFPALRASRLPIVEALRED